MRFVVLVDMNVGRRGSDVGPSQNPKVVASSNDTNTPPCYGNSNFELNLFTVLTTFIFTTRDLPSECSGFNYVYSMGKARRTTYGGLK